MRIEISGRSRFFHGLAMCAVLASPILSEAARGQEAGGSKFDAKALQMTVALMVDKGQGRVGVGITNPSDTQVWANVGIEAPGRVQCGVGKTSLAPGERTWVLCAVDNIVANKKYPITAEIYLDEKMSVSAGRKEGTGRFRHSDIEWLQNQLKPLVFPLTMTGVVHSDSVSLFATMGGKAGELLVNEEGLQYSNADKTLAIPVAQMLAVKPRIDRQHWIIVVEYQEGEESKTAVFQRSYGRGTHEGLDLFMRGLMAVYRPKATAQ
ncbi:MAG: hypothetical protein WD929_10375 [Steroidobacteraceae bacterium]